ncbi:hypothetical protein ASPWEDRAFT_175935 [Aspergillus wentii DTO 134E9]|uniref:HpcH/HpaI aldolase/citrate lyase domain-containing protein n=1 Tax=Aspergillus wentii DTO 134E9 TaxID=1073089 RepID=A0A1L9R7D3_ASPWE|nr:uncharacterized protein ASPWEDRAFT_175935 [Aspergillus wentii DTO 134E9]OJJ30831.1 hypothetical protein ASPWEDRAFT_175935 [Aspergillus wentii DTO 134E9]
MDRFQAMSLFQPSNLRRAISESMDKETKRINYHLLGTVLGVPHTTMARTLALLGFDFVIVDAQHEPLDAERMMQLIQTVNLSSQGKTVAIARVPSVDSHLVTHALDAGAAGIIFPHVDTPDQAAEAVRKSRYACSGGDRSLAPSALIPSIAQLAPPGTSYQQVADNNIAVICQIESPTGIENAEAIATTPGVDLLMLGPGDLRLAMGLPSTPVGGKEDPCFVRAVNHLVQVSRDSGTPCMAISFKVNTPPEWMAGFSVLCDCADLHSVMVDHMRKMRETEGLLKEVGSGRLSDVVQNGV